MNLNFLPSIPTSCMSVRMQCLHVCFSISTKIGTTCSLFAWAFLTVTSRDKIWSIVVRLVLSPQCSVDSVSFWSKKSNSPAFTNLSITLHRTLVIAMGRYFEEFVGSSSGFDFGIIVDSNDFPEKYSYCHILLQRTRRESDPSGRRFSTFHCGSCPYQDRVFGGLNRLG